MTDFTCDDGEPGSTNQAKLIANLSDAAATFSAARTQHDRLWSLHEYLDTVLDLLRLLPVTLPMQAPHNALSQAIAAQAGGSPHPLLATAAVQTRPKTSPARLVEQVSAVLASKILHRGGLKPGKADNAAAKLVSDLGVEGLPNKRVTQTTVTRWRSQAGKHGDNPEVGQICAYHLNELPEKLTPDLAAKAAKEFAVSFLATRYQVQDSAEG
ncbi:hypothetical protein GCM10011529_13190 [Polymorphobacter glacialis]|uniref:Uncharacterized protein n=1 Tax=Sandarakinorhabdus glacialis TaxID=1614636 RepID=A0A917E7H3_9SPHN|nr:hypothetical protein [Polymorphobacter glacialis]GGE08130.1 hypothetical protein GCM10011529_13190 [Polymorphobacter glacialis]